jgi:hypothetical protein
VGCSVGLRVIDGGGLWNEDDSAVAVRDTLPPAITCPADVTVQCDASTAPSVTGMALATDICSTPTVTYGDVTTPGACAAEYEIDRTWDAADVCLNDSQCVQGISVVDTAGPVIACNAADTITPFQAPISFTATATDNCSTPSVEITAFSCTAKTGRDKRESCVVEIAGPTVTILNSGGLGDTISWTVHSVDGCGNSTTDVCSVLVVNPGRKK